MASFPTFMEANSSFGQVSDLPRNSKQREQLTCELSASERAVWDPKDRGHLRARLSAETQLGWFCF
ncbi:unnamed protein product [Gulo gulo]|uniref:Uncharacterized protein n=1 Tax=Gulo gulo TaxID=48420 RepID=A0A9X9LNL2_GULGU|nr:unnamed protein product [Gulo gulo]